jgi:threonine dehydrogenase-like Zn-dependent dehydrogenase
MKVYPRVVGYCHVGRVLAVGADVEYPVPGDRVLTYQSHRSACVIPAGNIAAVLPETLDPVAASTAYLFHLGYNALLKADIRAGMHVAVVGLGVLGLTSTALAVQAGAEVYAFSNHQEAREKASAFGAKAVFAKDGRDRIASDLNDLTRGVGVDVVISTSNSWYDWELTMELVRRGGTIAVLGFPGRGQMRWEQNPLDSRWFYDKQLTLIACGFSPNLDVSPCDVRFTQVRNMAWLLDRIGAGRLPGRELVTDVLPAADLTRAYERLEAREPGLLTLSLEWRGGAPV